MTPRDQVKWALEQANALQSDMRFAPAEGMLVGNWTVAESTRTGASGGS